MTEETEKQPICWDATEDLPIEQWLSDQVREAIAEFVREGSSISIEIGDDGFEIVFAIDDFYRVDRRLSLAEALNDRIEWADECSEVEQLEPLAAVLRAALARIEAMSSRGKA